MEPHHQELLAAAEGALAERFGGAVRLVAPERLGGTRSRSAVLRCTLEGAPGSVILKGMQGDDPHRKPEAPAEWAGVLGRLSAEWAGGELLAPAGLARGCLAVVPDALLIVLEDLGPGSCLADHLQGGDRPAALQALTRYATYMGRLHAASIGREADFLALRADLGVSAPPQPTADRVPGGWLRENILPLLARLEGLGLTPPPGTLDELRAVAASYEEPGPFLALTPGDTCPDNHHVDADGRLRFFDFEFAGFRHALLDAAYFRVPFPTCWCVNRLPEDVVAQAERAYRAALIMGCPEAGDDALYHRELARTVAFWCLTSLTVGAAQGRDLVGALAQDKAWGLASSRQRHILRMDTLAGTRELPALGELARRLAALLRARWPEAELPLYPPFRSAAP